MLLAAMAREGVSRLVLSSSMVVYGEGSYACSSHGGVARPLPRAAADLEAGAFDPRCPACGARLSWVPVREDAALDPRNAYATSKVAQEHLAANWARVTGGAVVALRYHNVYGPRMPRDTPYSGVAAIFRSALENGQPPRVFEDGGQLRDFVHVRDVADANVLALAAADSAAAGGRSRLQRGERHPAHCRRDGGRSRSGLRWRNRAEDHRRVPARRRPAHRGLSGGSGL